MQTSYGSHVVGLPETNPCQDRIFILFLTVCPYAMDIVFALDSSTDVTPVQWTQQKDFMKKVADGFNVQESGTHAALVAYSTIPSINLKLGERNVKGEVDKAFDDLPRDPGNRNLVSQGCCLDDVNSKESPL